MSFVNLFFSLIEIKNVNLKHLLKKHKRKFKIDKIAYVRLLSQSTSWSYITKLCLTSRQYIKRSSDIKY